MAEVTLSYGLRDRVPIHISAITPEFNGNRCGCVCPACGKALQARTLGKSGKAIHFAHQSATHCQPETIQHWTAKYLLHWRINNAIANQKPLLINWRCEKCRKTYDTDLTASALAVEVESWIAPIRPDVATFDAQGNPLSLIEVVFHNPPDDAKRQYAIERKLILIEFHIKDDPEAALRTIETSEKLYPRRITPCRDAECESSAKPLNQDVLSLLPADHDRLVSEQLMHETPLQPSQTQATPEQPEEDELDYHSSKRTHGWLGWLAFGAIIVGLVSFRAFRSKPRWRRSRKW